MVHLIESILVAIFVGQYGIKFIIIPIEQQNINSYLQRNFLFQVFLSSLSRMKSISPPCLWTSKGLVTMLCQDLKFFLWWLWDNCWTSSFDYSMMWPHHHLSFPLSEDCWFGWVASWKKLFLWVHPLTLSSTKCYLTFGLWCWVSDWAILRSNLILITMIGLMSLIINIRYD